MLKKTVFLFSSIFCLSLSAIPIPLPHVIDLGSYSSESDNYQWKIGQQAFNSAPELIPFFTALKKDYRLTHAVETGTYQGATTVALALLFDKVDTIEIQQDKYDQAELCFKNYSNVSCHLGSSEHIFSTLLPSLANERTLFYLDAHWYNHWPLLEELEEISKTHRDNCIIVIDDFKVPGRPDIAYDYYGPHECSYEYIQEQLVKVYSSYDFYYLIPKWIGSRAKFVAIPKSWKK
jgi:predicted O-methyltransferase YrrM